MITPRDYSFTFRKMPSLDHHYAIIGMALVKDNYPLYFDGVNEEGLGMAGLNFDGPAHFFPVVADKDNVSPFEFIPYVLGQCKSVDKAKKLMANLSLVNINFSDQLQLSPLHWLIADRSGKSIVVESTQSGLHVYDNPVGVLTNNPEFPQQLTNLANYQSVSPAEPINTLTPGVKLNSYSRGIGSHLLHAVEQQKGLDEVAPDTFEYTIYSDGVNLTTGTFYYTTYDNNQINAVEMRNVNLNSSDLVTYPLVTEQAINHQN
mgnify:CR=1 FL=1